MNHYIYKIVHKETGKIYIGSRTAKVHKRFCEEFGTEYKTSSKRVQQLGINNFDWYLINEFEEGISQKEVVLMEHNIISQTFDEYGKQQTLNRFCMVNENARWGIHDDISRAKISEANKNRIITENTKLKLSKSSSGINNGMYGKNYSNEERLALSNSVTGDKNGMYGKRHSDESKIKMSNSSKKYFGKLNGMYDKKHSSETKLKISIAGKGRIFSDETKKKMSESRKNNIWITDGSINKLIPKDSDIPFGFYKGRSKLKDNDNV